VPRAKKAREVRARRVSLRKQLFWRDVAKSRYSSALLHRLEFFDARSRRRKSFSACSFLCAIACKAWRERRGTYTQN
jgi:hypothetical protein